MLVMDFLNAAFPWIIVGIALAVVMKRIDNNGNIKL